MAKKNGTHLRGHENVGGEKSPRKTNAKKGHVRVREDNVRRQKQEKVKRAQRTAKRAKPTPGQMGGPIPKESLQVGPKKFHGSLRKHNRGRTEDLLTGTAIQENGANGWMGREKSAIKKEPGIGDTLMWLRTGRKGKVNGSGRAGADSLNGWSQKV